MTHSLYRARRRWWWPFITDSMMERELSESAMAQCPQSSGAGRIAAERQRQVEREGWSESHDDSEHQSGELVYAAISYALHPFSDERLGDDYRVPAGTAIPRFWPWEDEWWKPTPKARIRELTKAGALIAAEIDRLLRGEVSQ